MSGLDDTFRPNVDGNSQFFYNFRFLCHLSQFITVSPSTFEDDNIPLSPPKNQTSYDELRIRNREEYAKKAQNPLYR